MPIMRLLRLALARSVRLFILALAISSFGIACGGGPAADEGLTFVFDETEEEAVQTAAAAEVADPFLRLVQIDDRQLRVAYLYDLWSMAQEIKRGSRTMTRLNEGALEPVSLDWVLSVHDFHRASEEFRLRAYNYPLPEDLAADYVDLHAAFLETVQLYSHASDRMLSGALLVGPTGRTSHDMEAAQFASFQSYIAESTFYLVDTEVLFTRLDEDLKELFRSMRVR